MRRIEIEGQGMFRAMTEVLREAEAEAARWRELHDDRDRDLAYEFARANAAEAEVERLRHEVVNAVHQGIAGATRAWSDKVDEANLSRDVAYIERDGALAEVERLRAALADIGRESCEACLACKAAGRVPSMEGGE